MVEAKLVRVKGCLRGKRTRSVIAMVLKKAVDKSGSLRNQRVGAAAGGVLAACWGSRTKIL